MKKLLIPFALVLLLVSCDKEEQVIPCGTFATVRDLSGLDGCGYVFELEDNSYLVPYFPWFCGTPPIPKEVLAHPLYNFEYVEGKQVYINYEVVPDAVSICMAGPMVTITCLTEIQAQD